MILSKTPLVAVLSAAVALSACTDPSSLGDPSNEKRNNGAILGAVVGAGLGAIVSDDAGKGALIGGVVGGLGGAAIGDVLDKQAAEMRESLSADGILVETADGKLIVTLPEDITFATDSSTVRPSLQSELNKVAANFVAYPDSNIQVVGHTDNEGEAGYNQALSERRANSVAAILQSGGVASIRVTTTGRGENQPVASNLTPEGRALNRRVEIIVTPTK